MDALSHWSLTDLIDRVLRERLVDECLIEDEYVIIVQGSTRFVLDHQRAHAFLRGVVRGMSPAFRWKSWVEEHGVEEDPLSGEAPIDAPDETNFYGSFRRHLVKKWWGRYERAGCPFGRSVDGLLTWIRYDTRVTVN